MSPFKRTVHWGKSCVLMLAVGCGTAPPVEPARSPPVQMTVADETPPPESSEPTPTLTRAKIECLDDCHERSLACMARAREDAADDAERRRILRRCGCSSEACEYACRDSSDWNMPTC